MDTTWFNEHLQEYGALIIFANVWLQQIGLPVPSVPTLIMAGSRVAALQALPLLGATVAASLLADWLWYLAGRRFGYRVLTLLCRLSINPGSCVTHAENRFVRWGVWSLLFAKFVPGFSTVAPPIAGALRMPLASFLLASAGGALLWAGLALYAGMLFEAQINQVLALLSEHGVRALGVIGIAIIGLLLWKLWQKRRFAKAARIPHISLADYEALLRTGVPVRLLDLRSSTLIAEAGEIPGAHRADYEDIAPAVAELALEHPIVTLCACPQDAAAIQAAKALHALGYTNARPLEGGFDAWKAGQDAQSS